ncbi:MAG: hypothetical protein MUF29_07160 [Chitinophagaceae bacterium]|nr:hypothetical protein [Chitinophagaceae bacterium]
MSKFLQFIVEETLAGRDNQLKEYTIGKAVLAKNGGFDPKQDASVRIHAFRLRKALQAYYSKEGSNSPIQIAVPTGTYRPAFRAIPSTAAWQQRRNGTVHHEETRNRPEDVICLLPFSSLVQGSPGMASSHAFCVLLNNKLSLFQNIVVVPYDTTLTYLNRGLPEQQVAKELGATYYLAGSIHENQGALHVSAQLFDACNGSFLWTQDFQLDAAGKDMTETMNAVSDQIVSALAGYGGYLHYRKFLANTREEPLSNNVANAVFWFYRYIVQHSEDVFQEAVRQLQQATREDPSCSFSRGILAHLYADGVIYGHATVPNPLREAQQLIHEALALHPHSQQAWLSQAWVHILNRNGRDARTALDKALSINPNSVDYVSMAALGMAMLGAYDQSAVLWDRAMRMNKIPYWWLNLAKVLMTLQEEDYTQALYYAGRPATPKMIYESVLEMVILHLMQEEYQVQTLASQYRQRFPGKFAFVCQALPSVIFDEQLHHKVADTLQRIKALHFADEVALSG